MKKLIMLAVVLLGTAAASQAGIDIRFGLPLPPLPRVIIGHPAPVVVAPDYCGPTYGCGYRYPHRHGYHRPVVHGYTGYSRGYRAYSWEHRGGGDCYDGRRGHR